MLLHVPKLQISNFIIKNVVHPSISKRFMSEASSSLSDTRWVTVNQKSYACDSYYNLTPKIHELVARKLHNQENHPLWLIKQRIAKFFNEKYPLRRPFDQPYFNLYDNLNPIVSVHQNFDSLLIPTDHVSRSSKDTYYINSTTLLRSHTSAHQTELISSGLDSFLLAGDVYRRDDIDRTHYPAFHQMEGVRLFSAEQLFKDAIDPSGCLQLLEPGLQVSLTNIPQSNQFHRDKQPCHTYETVNKLEFELKSVLGELAKELFGRNIKMRWVSAYFPFTHPSWELEIYTKVTSDNKDSSDDYCWMETLGCGLIRQEILAKCGVMNKVGYAFGLGLERWAMQLYSIPDIRLFWSKDKGFCHQFATDDISKSITYKPVSIYPPCPMDISFWLPEDKSNKFDMSEEFQKDLYDIIRSSAGDLVEQVDLIDEFVHPKTHRKSLCYRIVYRHPNKSLTLEEVRQVHQEIAAQAVKQFQVEIR